MSRDAQIEELKRQWEEKFWELVRLLETEGVDQKHSGIKTRLQEIREISHQHRALLHHKNDGYSSFPWHGCVHVFLDERLLPEHKNLNWRDAQAIVLQNLGDVTSIRIVAHTFDIVPPQYKSRWQDEITSVEIKYTDSWITHLIRQYIQSLSGLKGFCQMLMAEKIERNLLDMQTLGRNKGASNVPPPPTHENY